MFPIIPFVRPRRRHPSPATTTSPNTTDVWSLGPPLRPMPNYARIPSHQGAIGGPSVWVLEYPAWVPVHLGVVSRLSVRPVTAVPVTTKI